MRRLHLALVLVIVAMPAAAHAAGQGGRASVPTDVVDLERAIREALERSPALQPSIDDVTLAEISQAAVKGRYAPRLTPVVSAMTDPDGSIHRQVGVSLGQRFTFGTEVSVRADSQAYSVSVTQPLLQPFGPAATADLTNAERAVNSAMRRAVLAQEHLMLDVARTFYSVLAQQRLVEAGTRAVTRAQTLRASSEARTAVGLATRLDVLRADLLEAQAQAQLDLQQEQLAEQTDRLKVLLGRSLISPLTLAGGDTWTPVGSPPDVPLVQLTASALGSRVELLDAREGVRDAERMVKVARWRLVPDIGVTAGYTRVGDAFPTATVIARPQPGGWFAGISTTYELNRSSNTAVASAEVRVRAARRMLTDLEQQVEADVRRAHRARERADASVIIQTRAVELARQQLRLAELRYERGLAGNFDVIDAETNVFQAGSGLIAAQVARALADLALDRATGQLSPASFERSAMATGERQTP
jgi:outer membrane protein TolC